MRRRHDAVKRAAAAALLAAGIAAVAGEPTPARGRALFHGEAALSARIVHQDFALPVAASRCVNCHGPAPAAAPPSAASSAAPAPPALSAALLAEPRRRRGGPPSAYDAAALCRLLRTGIDPAHVLIQRTMPRYEIGDEDCRSLWLYLMETR